MAQFPFTWIRSYIVFFGRRIVCHSIRQIIKRNRLSNFYIMIFYVREGTSRGTGIQIIKKHRIFLSKTTAEVCHRTPLVIPPATCSQISNHIEAAHRLEFRKLRRTRSYLLTCSYMSPIPII